MTLDPSFSENGERLNKFLAFHLGASRRKADELIEKGRVQLNGQRAELGARLNTSDEVLVDGKPVIRRQYFSYYVLHKPRGYVCSRRQQGDTPTIYSLLPGNLHHLKPVGRLDADSSGLLLLSDDGDFAYHMTHPKFRKTKVYLVQLDTTLEPLHQQMISDFGIQLDDGASKFTVTRLEQPVDYPGFTASRPSYQVIMSEGRNRQIRRTFLALGYTVTSLHRTDFGPYQLGDLAVGKTTTCTPNL